MFGIGTTELIIILALALIILGPARLPEVARTLGKGLASLRRTAEEVKREINLAGIKEELLEDTGLDEIKKDLDIRHEIEQALSPHSGDEDSDDPDQEGGTQATKEASEPGAEVTDSRKNADDAAPKPVDGDPAPVNPTRK